MTELMRDFDRMAERIEGLVDSQSRLLKDVSHELRSPLARLSVALGLARQRATPEVSPELDSSLSRIELEAEERGRVRSDGARVELQFVAPHEPEAGAYWGFNFEAA